MKIAQSDLTQTRGTRRESLLTNANHFLIETMGKPNLIKRILYLDFDGVLHDGEVYFHSQRGICVATQGRTLFEWMSVLESLLKPHRDIKIVLSTSWAVSFGAEFAKAQLSQALQKRVIGGTLDSEEGSIMAFVRRTREEQISNDVKRRQPESWLALDDDRLAWSTERQKNLIRTKSNIGISSPAIQETIRARLEFG